MAKLFFGFIVFVSYLTLAQSSIADLRLKWQYNESNSVTEITLSYKDKNHIIISNQSNHQLLKLNNTLYLLQNIGGVKIAYNLSNFINRNYRSEVLKSLPSYDIKFLPVMVIYGQTQSILGYEGNILLLKDYHKSVTIINSMDQQHLEIKNALLPMLLKLSRKFPNLPNKNLLEILKIAEFGLPLKINNQIILSDVAHINLDASLYSLADYYVINTINDRFIASN